MSKTDDIQKEEKQLSLKEEKLSGEINQVKKIKERYNQHFYEAKRFFEDVCYQFNKNDQRNYFKSTFDEFSHSARKAMESLEDNEKELGAEKKKILNDLEDIQYKKRELFSQEDKNNEH